jgi:ABC-type multidrug transport system fused ATPase/permease subunit
MSAIYRIFDTTLECDFPLPELPQLTGRSISVTVKLADEDLFDTAGFEKTFEWFSTSGQSICWCERRANEYLYVFPRHASYHISNVGVISCFKQQESSMQMLRQLLLNQIIPRYLATRGQLVLHASAVRLENGRSLAFLGNSGFGKSTLASSFHRNGAQLISDDSILLRPGDDGVTVIGGFPGIRLFPDSMHAVLNEVRVIALYVVYA